MNLSRSLHALGRICREDAAFRRLGKLPAWSIYFHYLGRWYDRRRAAMPVRNIPFTFAGDRITFSMTDRYLGAFRGVFVDHEYDCSRHFPKAPRTIIDLGGNIGFGSVYLSRLFRDARFAVVEPDPRNLAILQPNLVRNRVAATVIDAAVGPAEGKLRLRFGADPTCSSLEDTGMHDLRESVAVDVTTVPVVMARMGWSSVDLVKIDIEGAEEVLLARNNDWLSAVGALLLEIHPNTSAEALNRPLSRHGFHLQRLGNGREPVYFARRNEA